MKKENEKTWIERWEELKYKMNSAKKPLTWQERFRLVSREAEEGNMYARLEVAEMYLKKGETEKAVEILKECEQDGIVGAVSRLGKYTEKRGIMPRRCDTMKKRWKWVASGCCWI